MAEAKTPDELASEGHDQGVALFSIVAQILLARAACPRCNCLGLATAIGSMIAGADDPALRAALIADVNAEIERTIDARLARGANANAVRPQGSLH